MKNRIKFCLFILTIIVGISALHAQKIKVNVLEKEFLQSNLTLDNNITGNYIKTISPDTQKILRNPLSGWALYANSSFNENYWKRYDSIHLPDSLNTIKIEDYATTLYLRLSWAILNPKENEYSWKTNKKFKELIAEARRRQMHLAFRVVVDSRDKSSNFTPQYVRDAGAEGYETKTGSKTVWSPYPDDSIFQSKYEKFIKAFAKRFNNADEVEFIDGYGLGKWGEGHAVIYKDYENKEKVFKWIINLYPTYFNRVPIAINYHREIGDTISWGAPNIMSERLLDYAVNKGYILRHDAFGMTDYYQQWEKNYANKWLFKRPIIQEGGWVTNLHNIKLDPRHYQSATDVRKGEFDDAAHAHVNMMDFRFGETLSWFEQYPLVEKFNSIGSYRLYPDKISLPKEIENGSFINITHEWNNAGWGYCPNNIPLWNFKYKVAFALLKKSDSSIIKIFVDKNSDPSKWIQGHPISYSFRLKIVEMPAGEYIWAVAIVNTREDNKIEISLGAQGLFTKSGWLTLFNTKVLN